MHGTVKALLAVAVVVAAATQPDIASAQSYSSRPLPTEPLDAYTRYARMGPYPHFAAPRYAYRHYGYRPAYYGYRRYGWYGRPYYRGYYGAPLAAGLIGGLALGTLARPYYYGPAY